MPQFDWFRYRASAMPTYKLLLADPKGRVVEHPWLLASLRSDESILPPTGKPIALPEAGVVAFQTGLDAWREVVGATGLEPNLDPATDA